MATVGPSLGLRVYTATLTLASLAMAAFLFYTSTASLLTSPLPSTYILHSELVATSVLLALAVVAWHLLPLLSGGGEFVSSKAEAEEGRCIRWEVWRWYHGAGAWWWWRRCCCCWPCWGCWPARGCCGGRPAASRLAIRWLGGWWSWRSAKPQVVSKAVPVPLTPLGMPPLVHALVFCDVHDNCTSIYQETQVLHLHLFHLHLHLHHIHLQVNISGKFLRTWPCQSVALTLVLDPACLQYSSFSSLLPVLRILLPLLAALLLPALLHLCVGLQGQAHSKRHTRKHMTSRTSWSGLEEPCYQPALPPTDPVLHYKEMCLPLDARGRMVHRPASTHAIAAVSPAPADASLQPLFTSTLQVPGMDASTFSSPGAMAASTPRASAEEGEGRLYSTVERPAGLSTFQRTPRRHSRYRLMSRSVKSCFDDLF